MIPLWKIIILTTTISLTQGSGMFGTVGLILSSVKTWIFVWPSFLIKLTQRSIYWELTCNGSLTSPGESNTVLLFWWITNQSRGSQILLFWWITNQSRWSQIMSFWWITNQSRGSQSLSFWWITKQSRGSQTIILMDR